MKTQKVITGFLLIAAPILFMGAFTLLQINFEYPDILRQPAGYVLERYAAGGSGLVANWYAMLFSALLFIPIAVLLHPFLAREDTWYLPLATTLGVLAGIVQMLGFVRWPFLVPALATSYLNPAASETTREMLRTAFLAFNQYAGVGIGEHLGYIFTAFWSLLVGLAMLGSHRFPRWLGWVGILASLGIIVGLLEPAGATWAGAVNAMAYVFWALWLLLSGILLLIRGDRP
ncbi:MAG: DUF4386 domain-containing protein [Anaerolineaceae bacterium]|jgi:hypothetical protein